MRSPYIAVSIACLASACGIDSEPAWNRGDVACIALSGERAMVVDRYETGSWHYQLRLGRAEQTSSGLLGPTIRTDRSYATVWFYEYELEECR